MFESMACGVPVIVREGTLAADIVRQWNCGITVDPGNNNFLTELMHAKQDPRRLSVLGAAGREAFLGTFNWDSMEVKLLKLYSELTSELWSPEKVKLRTTQATA
jgi:glycosyltransferase involved in cell wall biosynthesis